MRLSFPWFVFFPALLIAGCHDKHIDRENRELATFSQTPHFIKSFLDTLYKGKFSIAEKGEKWNSGCVQYGALPSCQFISARIHDNRYELTFWQGGFVCTKQNVTIQFTDTTVDSCAFRK